MMRIRKYILIMMYMMGMNMVLANSSALAETDKPKLRWEYKYQEGETLYYRLKKKYNRPIFEYKGIKLGGQKFEGEVMFTLKVESKDENGRVKINGGDLDIEKKVSDQAFLESRGIYWMDIDGNVKGMNAEAIFLMSQPQFSESGLDMWNKEIKLFSDESATIIGYYRILEKENILKGKKCVVIETEIGQVENGTDAEKGAWTSHIGNKTRIKIKAKTWFDSKDGKIIKMEAAKGCEGESEEAVYELLDESEIKKLDGIEDDWQLVLPGVNNFQLTGEGKIVYVKEVVSDELGVVSGENKDLKPQNSELRTQNFIYICDGDGSNQRRLTEGTNPVVSPDGKWVAVNDKDGKLKVVDKGTGEENKEILKNIDSIAVHTVSWLFSYIFLKEKLPNSLKVAEIWWSDNHKKVIFTNGVFETMGRKFYMYDIENDKLIDVPDLSAMNIYSAYLSPKDLIFVYEEHGGEFRFGLLYLSPDGKITKKVNLGEIGLYAAHNWTNEGNFLIYYLQKGSATEGNKEVNAHIYSIKTEKVIVEMTIRNIYDLIDFSSDFKYAYFRRGGFLTKKQAIYRISTPKELQGKIAREK